MKIIEFFGATRVGKSFLFKKFKSTYNEKIIFTYKTIFYFYLFKSNKISYLKYLLIKFLIINEVGKTKNLSIKIFSKYYFNIEENTKNEKNKLFKIIKFKHKKFLKLYFDLLDKIKNNNEKNTLKKWLIDTLIGYELGKKKYKNSILISPEGIYQRIYSVCIRLKVSKKNMKKLIALVPKIDQIYLIKKNSLDNKNIKKISSLINKKKINYLVINNNKNNSEKNVKKIINNLT